MSFERNDMKHLPINLENYEEYFLLYVDNELTEAEKKDVELFISQHPELKEEWMMLMDTKLEPEDIRMDLKKDLYRSEKTEGINESNYETFQLSWLDNELSDLERQAIETYTRQHPEAAANFELLGKTKLPAEDIRFPDKSVLYRTAEKPAIVISIKWYRMAVAAAILIAAGLWFINRPDEVEIPIDPVTVAQDLPKAPIETPQATEKTDEGTTKQETTTENPSAENNNETVGVTATRTAVEPRTKENTRTSEKENHSVAIEEKTSRQAVENVSRGRIEDVVTMASDPMTATNQLSAQPAVALDVKSDYATEALMVSNGNTNEQPEVTDDGKQRKGMFRGIVRKTTRFYNKVTNPDPDRPLVKVANFEIGLPR
jgi:hypothetical protein